MIKRKRIIPDSVEILNMWQKDMMTKSSGVFVSWFELSPQSTGFNLIIKIITPDKKEGKEYSCFTDSIEECIQQALYKIENEKIRLRKELE